MLVSIIVATYNSQRFVEEALESIKEQSYRQLELIITDDASTDTTVEICRLWIRNNYERFERVELLTVPDNTGSSANCNRGLAAARGVWIKFCAGDDTLRPDCIHDNMSWLISDTSAKVLFSKVNIYNAIVNPENLIRTVPDDPYNPDGIMAPGRNADSQYRMLLVCDRIHFTPSVFLNGDLLRFTGGFDEQFRLMEDYPLWLNLTRSGHRLFFMDKVTMNYRQHSSAVNNMIVDYLLKPNYFRTEPFRRIYTYPNLPYDIRLSQKFTWYASQIFRINRLNSNKAPNRVFHSLLTVYLNPFSYLIWFRKRLKRNLKNIEFYL